MLPLNFCTTGSSGSGGVPECRKKSGWCRRLASGYAGYVVFASRANPRFSAFIHDLLSCRRRHSIPVNCVDALPLYCVQLYALPDPCTPIAATATSPCRLRTVLCNSRSYNSRTADCPRCRVWHAQRTHVIVVRRVRRSYCKFRQ